MRQVTRVRGESLTPVRRPTLSAGEGRHRSHRKRSGITSKVNDPFPRASSAAGIINTDRQIKIKAARGAVLDRRSRRSPGWIRYNIHFN